MNLSAESLIEAALLLQAEPISERRMRELCQPPLSQDKLVDVLANLKTRWQNRALQLVCTAEGWRFQLAAEAFEPLGSLHEQRWIEVIGQRDSIGKPSLWATTAAFLSDLQLGSLADLPPLTDLGALVLPDMPEPPAAQEEAHDSDDTDQ